MANKMLQNGNKREDDKVTRIARILITLAIVLFVGYMVTRLDGNTDRAQSSDIATKTGAEEKDIAAEIESGNEIYKDTQIEASVEEYHFRNNKLLDQHFEKHGMEMGFATAQEYEKAASGVINNPEALFKTEAEDGDGVYYVEATNEFVILSTDGYIRTYFNPSGGKSYFDRQ